MGLKTQVGKRDPDAGGGVVQRKELEIFVSVLPSQCSYEKTRSMFSPPLSPPVHRWEVYLCPCCLNTCHWVSPASFNQLVWAARNNIMTVVQNHHSYIRPLIHWTPTIIQEYHLADSKDWVWHMTGYSRCSEIVVVGTHKSQKLSEVPPPSIYLSSWFFPLNTF